MIAVQLGNNNERQMKHNICLGIRCEIWYGFSQMFGTETDIAHSEQLFVCCRWGLGTSSWTSCWVRTRDWRRRTGPSQTSRSVGWSDLAHFCHFRKPTSKSSIPKNQQLRLQASHARQSFHFQKTKGTLTMHVLKIWIPSFTAKNNRQNRN